jgi:hypothetical protein
VPRMDVWTRLRPLQSGTMQLQRNL